MQNLCASNDASMAVLLYLDRAMQSRESILTYKSILSQESILTQKSILSPRSILFQIAMHYSMPYFFSRSPGRSSRVRSRAMRSCHSLISLGLPLRRTSGTFQPLNSAGLV